MALPLIDLYSSAMEFLQNVSHSLYNERKGYIYLFYLVDIHSKFNGSLTAMQRCQPYSISNNLVQLSEFLGYKSLIATLDILEIYSNWNEENQNLIDLI